MHTSSSRQPRLRRPGAVLAAGLVGAALTLAGAGPAAAYPYGPREIRTTSVVTRLSLTDGAGTLTIQPHFWSTSWSGFEVVVPAGDGVWSGPDVVPVPELGTTCRRDPGPDLVYRCGQTRDADPEAHMPVGSFQVGIPVHHTGTAGGLAGQSLVAGAWGLPGDSDEIIETGLPDWFPVWDQPHARSTAEVRLAPMFHGAPQTGSTTVPVTLSVPPDEVVTALDIDLPPFGWRLTGTDAARLGLQCFVRTLGPSLHCQPKTGVSRFAPGRYTLAAHLDWHSADERDPESTYSSVALTVGGVTERVDDFLWTYTRRY